MEWMLGEKYKVIKETGAGGGGRIFKVYDCCLDRVWAAKKLEQDNCGAEEQILQSVESVFMVRIVDRVEQEGEHYLIMDWIDGESLQQKIDRTGAVSIREAVTIGIALCRAFEQLHSMEPPVLYLDCKPSNIMLEKGGRVLLIDFGSAVRKGETKTVPIAVSFGYAAPEQQHADPVLRWADERSDIFSLGKTLYAILGGKCPDKPPYGMQRLRRVNGRVPASLSRIVEKCYEKDPDARYQTVSALRSELEKYEQKEAYRKWGWRSAGALILALLLASAWEFSEGLLFIIQNIKLKGFESEIWKSIFGAVRQVIVEERYLQNGLGWFLSACIVCRIRKYRLGKREAKWEMTQSVLRTMKKQGSWCMLILALWLWSIPAAGKEEKELFGLRDEKFRRLLIREGAVLETKESIYIELDPASFSKDEVYTISVSGTDEEGREEVFSFLYRPAAKEKYN